MIDDERTARAALSRLFEPQDAAALALVQAAGAQDALRIASGALAAGPGLEQEVTGILADSGSGSGWSGLSEALKRWAPRVPDLAPERDLATVQRLGGRLIIPTDDLWPRQLADLGLQEPLCLWWRGVEQELPPAARSIALVGSRDSTSYGASVTGDLAYSLAQRGFTIVSGGAYVLLANFCCCLQAGFHLGRSGRLHPRRASLSILGEHAWADDPRLGGQVVGLILRGNQ